MWYLVFCPFQGPTDEGSKVELYIELDGDFDGEKSWDLIQQNKNKIERFNQHSLDTEVVKEVGDLSSKEVQELVWDIFNPDYALFNDGRVYTMKYVNECMWVEE